MRYYLTGPMTGIPQFNFPLFRQVTAELRADGYDVVSPTELDEDGGTDKEALASRHGDPKDLTATWGDLLSRDVKLISDGVQAIIFLPNWADSRGAKLEAFVGLLQGKKFLFYVHTPVGLKALCRAEVLLRIVAAMVGLV